METNQPAQTVEYLLGRLDGKVDTILNTMHGYDKRLTAVEKKQWWLSGAGTVVGVVVAKFAPFASLLPR